MSLNVSKTKLMYIASRHKQQTLANCDHDINICDSKTQVCSVEKLLDVTISNTLCWDAHIDPLIKKCNSYLFLLSRIKVFLSRRNRILFYNSYILPHLDFCWIIWGNCSFTFEDKLVKIQKRAARVILDCDFYTPSLELFKEFNWQTFPERVTYQKAILIYRIFNDMCPDYLKKTMSHILLTYHVEILDLLTIPNYIRQTLTGNFSASHSCTLELLSEILSPYMLKMQLRLTLLNLYI